MTRDVVTVAEDTPLAEIARILEEEHIKRVPVVRDGRLVGIVSRANLLHGLASDRAPAPPPAPSGDRALRDEVLTALRKEPWATPSHTNATVSDGVVHLWGLVENDEEIKAYGIAAAHVPGVKSVENHLRKIESRVLYGGDA
jgi:CBS-domain-containing membrane protein